MEAKTETRKVCSNCGAELVEREQNIPRLLWDSIPETRKVKVCPQNCTQIIKKGEENGKD